jgi:hypothetical protein
MSPVRVWFGLVFLAMGVLGILDVTDTVAWSQTFEGWWPVAIVGWGFAEMLSAKRWTLGGTIIATIGLTLLADEQRWPAEGVVWSLLFILVGIAILAPRARGTVGNPDEGRAATPITPAAQT